MVAIIITNSHKTIVRAKMALRGSCHVSGSTVSTFPASTGEAAAKDPGYDRSG